VERLTRLTLVLATAYRQVQALTSSISAGRLLQRLSLAVQVLTLQRLREQ
jgi:hypothetical protein